MYNIVHEAGNRGTNLVITAIQSNDEVPGRVAPLIIVSTLLTHLCGGSAGREGAALQVGGALGNTFAKLFKFDEKDTRIMIMCGMSACFSALFGTPIASAVFSMEVISVGVMYYAALVPCVLAAFIAQGIASALGLESTHFVVDEIASFSFINGSKFIIMSVLFALASILLCVLCNKLCMVCIPFKNAVYSRNFGRWIQRWRNCSYSFRGCNAWKLLSTYIRTPCRIMCSMWYGKCVLRSN